MRTSNVNNKNARRTMKSEFINAAYKVLVEKFKSVFDPTDEEMEYVMPYLRDTYDELFELFWKGTRDSIHRYDEANNLGTLMGRSHLREITKHNWEYVYSKAQEKANNKIDNQTKRQVVEDYFNNTLTLQKHQDKEGNYDERFERWWNMLDRWNTLTDEEKDNLYEVAMAEL